MSDKFKAIVLNQSGDKFSREVKNLDTSFFKSGNVLVKVDYSGLNSELSLSLTCPEKSMPGIWGYSFTNLAPFLKISASL